MWPWRLRLQRHLRTISGIVCFTVHLTSRPASHHSSGPSGASIARLCEAVNRTTSLCWWDQVWYLAKYLLCLAFAVKFEVRQREMTCSSSLNGTKNKLIVSGCVVRQLLQPPSNCPHWSPVNRYLQESALCSDWRPVYRAAWIWVEPLISGWSTSRLWCGLLLSATVFSALQNKCPLLPVALVDCNYWLLSAPTSFSIRLSLEADDPDGACDHVTPINWIKEFPRRPKTSQKFIILVQVWWCKDLPWLFGLVGRIDKKFVQNVFRERAEMDRNSEATDWKVLYMSI